MATEGLTIAVDAATADAQRGLATVRSSLESTGDEATEAATRMRLLARGLDSVGDEATEAAAKTAIFGTTASGASAGVTALSIATSASLVPALTLLSTVLLPITATLGVVAAAAGGVAAAFGLIVGSGAVAGFERLKAALEGAKAQITVLLETFGKQFVPLLATAVELLPELVRRVLASVGGLDEFADVLGELGALALDLVPQIVGGLVDLGREALPAIRDVISVLRRDGPGAFRRIADAARRVGPLLLDVVDALLPLVPKLLEIGTIVATTILPALTDLIGFVDDVAGAFLTLNEQTDGLAGELATVAAVATTVVGGLVGLIAKVGGLSAAVTAAKLAVSGILTALGALSTPVLAVAAAVGTLAVAWQTNFADIRGVASRTLGGLTSLADQHLPGIIAEFEQLASTIDGVVTGAIRALTPVVRAVLPVVETLFNGFLTTVGTAFEQTFDVILTTVRVALNLLNGDVGGALSAIEGLVRRSLGRVERLFRGLGGTLSDAISAAVPMLVAAAGGLVDAVQGAVQYLWGTGEGTLTGDVTQALIGIGNTVRSLSETVIRAAFEALVDVAESVLASIDVSGILDALDAVVSTVEDIVSELNELAGTNIDLDLPDPSDIPTGGGGGGGSDPSPDDPGVGGPGDPRDGRTGLVPPDDGRFNRFSGAAVSTAGGGLAGAVRRGVEDAAAAAGDVVLETDGRELARTNADATDRLVASREVRR